MGSVFDSEFESDDILFYLDKSTTWGPKPFSTQAALSLNQWGECKRECEPKECVCDDPSGDCPDSDCFGSPEACECWDEALPGSLGRDGRCRTGSFCWQEGGVDCTSCCEPVPPKGGGNMCLKMYREEWQGSPDVGLFKEDTSCPGDSQGQGGLAALEESVGSLSSGCGCKTGLCKFRTTSLPIPVSPGSYSCVSNVTKKQCQSIAKAAGAWELFFGTQIFFCCKTGENCACDTEECPAGQPLHAPCAKSEYFIHNENNAGLWDECYCKCFTSHQLDNLTLNGNKIGNICAVCGDNSTWKKTTRTCDCAEGYVTNDGRPAYNLLDATIGPEEPVGGGGGTDGYRRVTFPDCVPADHPCTNCAGLNKGCCLAGDIWNGAVLAAPKCITCADGSEFKLTGSLPNQTCECSPVQNSGCPGCNGSDKGCCVAGKIWNGAVLANPTCITCVSGSEFKITGDTCECSSCNCDAPVASLGPVCVQHCIDSGTPAN